MLYNICFNCRIGGGSSKGFVSTARLNCPANSFITQSQFLSEYYAGEVIKGIWSDQLAYILTDLYTLNLLLSKVDQISFFVYIFSVSLHTKDMKRKLNYPPPFSVSCLGISVPGYHQIGLIAIHELRIYQWAHLTKGWT